MKRIVEKGILPELSEKEKSEISKWENNEDDALPSEGITTDDLKRYLEWKNTQKSD